MAFKNRNKQKKQNRRKRTAALICAAVLLLCSLAGENVELHAQDNTAEAATEQDAAKGEIASLRAGESAEKEKLKLETEEEVPSAGPTPTPDRTSAEEPATTPIAAPTPGGDSKEEPTPPDPDGGEVPWEDLARETEAREQISRTYAVSDSARKEAAKRKFLFIGDSYATVSSKRHVYEPWPEMFCESLGISTSDQMYARRGGAGFSPEHKKNAFANLVKKKQSSKKVTDIVIMGGIWNDSKTGMEKIRKNAKNLDTLLKKKYPNARIIYAACNWWYGNKAKQNLETKRRALYRKMALDNGWIYLEGTGDVLHGHREYFWKDHHHPNALGSMAIGYALASAYEKICLSDVQISVKTLRTKRGRRQKLSVAIGLPEMNSAGVTWKSSKKKVVSVSKDGTIIAKRRGRAIITAKTKYGGRTVRCVVRVYR